MRGLADRSLPRRVALGSAAVVVVVVAVLVGTTAIGQPSPTAMDGGPSGPPPASAGGSDAAATSSASDVVAVGSPAPATAPPVPIPTPDAAQAALVAAGWTFRPLPDAGLSIVLPPGWSSGAPGDRWAAERDALSAIATQHALFKPFVDASIASIVAGRLDIVGVDTSASALASGGGAIVDGSRWATNAASDVLVEGLKSNAPDSADPASYEQHEQDLAAGHGLRLTFRYTSPRTDKAALGISWVVHTPRGVFVLRFRADTAEARGLAELAETVAGSLRPLAGRRDDQVAGLGQLEPVALVLDASDDVSAEWLEAEKQATIDFLAELSWSESVTIVASGGSTPRVVVPLTAVYSRGPLDRAIRSIERSGKPDAAAAVAAARAELEQMQVGGRQIVVLAASSGGLDGAAILESFKNPDQSRDADLRGIALGRGAQEGQLFALAGGTYAYNGYAVAPTPADVGRALSLVRRSWDIGLLPIASGRAHPGAPVSVLLPAGVRQVRFVVDAPSWVAEPAVIDPAGRRIGLDTPQPAAAIVEGGGRTSIVVPAPAPGTWALDVAATGSAPVDDVGFAVEAFGTRLSVSSPRGESEFGAGGPLAVAVAVSDYANAGSDGTLDGLDATLAIDDPAGVSHHVRFDRTSGQDLGISGGTVEGVTVTTTRIPGSYHLLIAVGGKDADGVPFRVQPETWHYLEPSVDSDGDGFADAFERQIGMDPTDPSDARSDDDRDGLPLDREMFDLGTSPSLFDSDGGREGDGSEVAAGRDPTDPADDVPMLGCLDATRASPTPAAGGAPTPAPSADRDAALEALLPARILGRSTTRYSIVGHPEIDPFVGSIARVMAECIGATAADVTLGYSIATDLGNWGVVAIRVRGHTATEVEDIFLHRLRPGQEDSLDLREAELDGRRYWRSGNGWALYANGPTLYWVLAYTYGDTFGASPPPIPPADEIVEDIIRQLPPA